MSHFFIICDTQLMEIQTINNLDDAFKQLQIDGNDLILISTSLLLDFSQRKKKTHKKKTSLNAPLLTPLPLKKEEYKGIVNNYLKKYPLCFLFHKGQVEVINYFHMPDNIKKSKLFLPVKMRSYNRDPVLMGNILYGNFVREEVLIHLLCFYKKLNCRRVIYITYGKPNINLLNSQQHLMVISVKD